VSHDPLDPDLVLKKHFWVDIRI